MEEYRLRVFENEVLGIFGCKRKVTGGWRKLEDKRFYASPTVVRVFK
jgi:hypothetical protein